MTAARALTAHHLAVLDWVREFIAPLGLSPSLRVIAQQFGVSRTAAHRTVQVLIAAGKLRRVNGELRLVDRPDLRAVPTDELAAELDRRGVSLAALNPRGPAAYARGSVSCAADSCAVAVKRGHLFCREHWFQLPGGLRDRILRSFGARDVPAYQDAVAEARDLIDGFSWSQAS